MLNWIHRFESCPIKEISWRQSEKEKEITIGTRVLLPQINFSTLLCLCIWSCITKVISNQSNGTNMCAQNQSNKIIFSCPGGSIPTLAHLVTELYTSHWQESQSRKISRRNYSLFSRSLKKNEFSFLFLFSIFKIFRKKFHFPSRFVRFLNPFSFSSWFSRFWRKISLSLLDWWDSETQISFSSRFSRYLEKILFLFSIYEIFENNSLSLLNFQGF